VNTVPAPVIPAGEPGEPHDLFLRHRAVIERTIRGVAARWRLRREEAEDFASDVRLRLLHDRCAVLRRYEGRGAFGTFLGVVVRRLCLDQRRSSWGNWRPSKGARRLGPAAVLLQQFVERDGLPLDEACARIAAAGLEAPSPSDVHGLVAAPRCWRRMAVGEEALDSLATDRSQPDVPLRRRDRRRALEALRRALQGLPAVDRRLLALRYSRGMRVSDVARLDGCDQKRLYRRIEAALRRLRARLAAQGITASDVGEWLGVADCDEHVPAHCLPFPAPDSRGAQRAAPVHSRYADSSALASAGPSVSPELTQRSLSDARYATSASTSPASAQARST
jgi:RNA polymerase sigma factor (sigma-70 family)